MSDDDQNNSQAVATMLAAMFGQPGSGNEGLAAYGNVAHSLYDTSDPNARYGTYTDYQPGALGKPVAVTHRVNLDVLNSIGRAAKETGCPLDVSLKIINQESSFNTNSDMGNISSAKGLFQLMRAEVREDADWRRTPRGEALIAKHPELNGPFDPKDAYLNSLVGMTITMNNRDGLIALHHKLYPGDTSNYTPTVGEIYLAHFGGMGRARITLTELARGNPNGNPGFSAAEVAANPYVAGLTAQGLMDWSDRKMNKDVSGLEAKINGDSSPLIASAATPSGPPSKPDHRSMSNQVAALANNNALPKPGGGLMERLEKFGSSLNPFAGHPV